MQETEHRVVAWRMTVCCLALFSMFSAVAQAQPELNKVRDMLKRDTERALANERSRQAATPADKPPRPTTARIDRLSVTSIYGTSGKLTAIVLINGERKEYREGAALARGGTTASRDYRLQRIEDSCVYLQRPGKGDVRVSCYATPIPAGTSALAIPSPGMPTAGRPPMISLPSSLARP